MITKEEERGMECVLENAKRTPIYTGTSTTNKK